MSKVFEVIDEKLAAFIGQQKVFFVATAPLAAEAHVNLSPKGLDTFRILGPREVAYLDLTGSGAETIAHLRENGRMTLLFCAFDGPPKIVRLHGRGRVVSLRDEGFPALAGRFPAHPGARAVIVLDVQRVSDSCGFAVPRYEYRGDRSQLVDWAAKKDDLATYRKTKNAESIDGLPAWDDD